MMDTVETRYRIVCDECGYYADLTVGMDSAVKDPAKHFKSLGWIFEDGCTYCSQKCIEALGGEGL